MNDYNEAEEWIDDTVPQVVGWIESSVETYVDAAVDVFGGQIAEDANRLADAFVDKFEDVTLGIENRVEDF